MKNAIVIDLDSTLAIIGDRKPYDASNANELDDINQAVKIVIDSYLKYDENNTVIFLTGRLSKYRTNTMEFLSRCGFYEYSLFMRGNNDFRKSYIYKQDIYENYIKDSFNIDFIIDDNTEVIKMFRELGLMCFQLEDKKYDDKILK